MVRTVLQIQFFRFLLVGVVNTGFSYGLYAAFLWLGLNYVVANFLATVIGILFAFVSQGRLVFRGQGVGRLPRFVGVWIVIWLANILMIREFHALGLNAYWAGAAALPPTVLLSYFSQKYIVFNPAAAPPGAAGRDCRENS